MTDDKKITISNLKKDYKNNVFENKQILLQKISEKDMIAYEKKLLIEQFKNEKNMQKQELKNEIKKVINPVRYEQILLEKKVEEKIVLKYEEYFKNINKKNRELKKWKKTKASKNEVLNLKKEIKNYKNDQQELLKQSINEIKNQGNVNSIRNLCNVVKVNSKNTYNKMMPILGKIATQRHLMAIRNAFSSLIPFIMISSFITVFRFIPTSLDPNATHAYLYTYFPEALNSALVMISSLTLGIMALAISIAVGINLGQNYGEAPLMSGMMGLLGFILWVGPTNFIDGSQGLPLTDLGSRGLFVALVTSIMMFELYRLFKKYRITIRLPKQVPPAVSNSFIAIIPAVIYAIIVLSIRYIANFDLINEMESILKPIGYAINDNFGAVILIVLLNSLFWWFGIHGSAITGIITYPFWYPAIAQNTEWWNAGGVGTVPNLFVEPFYQWTIWVGGAGSTIGLAICSICFSRSKQNKAISKATFVPAVFNISEPMMFGFPVVLNIWLFIPFMLAPVATAITSAIFVKIFAISWVTLAPWSLPGPIGAFLASGNNWGAIVTCIVSCAVATLVYFPFWKAYDSQILKSEQELLQKEADAVNMSVLEYMKKQAKDEMEIKLKKSKILNK